MIHTNTIECLSDETLSLKDRNKLLLLFLQRLIKENKIDVIHKLLPNEKLEELHPSLKKSFQIMMNID